MLKRGHFPEKWKQKTSLILAFDCKWNFHNSVLRTTCLIIKVLLSKQVKWQSKAVDQAQTSRNVDLWSFYLSKNKREIFLTNFPNWLEFSLWDGVSREIVNTATIELWSDWLLPWLKCTPIGRSVHSRLRLLCTPFWSVQRKRKK